MADFLSEDLIGVAGQDLPTDHVFPNLTPCVRLFSLMRSQSTPSSTRVSYCDGFSWVSDEPVDDMLVTALSVAKDVVFFGGLDMHHLSDG